MPHVVVESGALPSSESALALALSTAIYRPILMGIASKGLSGRANDSIPMRRHLVPPNTLSLHGEKAIDSPELAKLGIKF